MRKKWPISLEHGHTPENIAERLRQRRGEGGIRDLVYGAIDGTVTTFSIVAGVSGAELSTAVIIILGVSNVLSDGFSMASGNYLATRSELDMKSMLAEFEKEQIDLNPIGETEEIRQIFKAKGFEGGLLERVVKKITLNREEWVQLMLTEEYGISTGDRSPIKSAAMTFLAFIFFGLIPLSPYILNLPEKFLSATIMTGFAFFLLGFMKSVWSLESAWISGVKTFVLGSVAAGLAYLVGVVLKEIVK